MHNYAISDRCTLYKQMYCIKSAGINTDIHVQVIFDVKRHFVFLFICTLVIETNGMVGQPQWNDPF